MAPKVSIIKELEEQINKTDNIEQKAKFHFEIWELNKDLSHQSKALEFYSTLFKETKNPKFKNRMRKLENSSIDFAIFEFLIDIVDSNGNQEVVFKKFINFLVKRFDAGNCLIVKPKDLSVLAWFKEFDEDETKFSKQVIREALKQNEAIYYGNVIDTEKFEKTNSLLGKFFLSVIVVPIISKSETIAVLYLDRSDTSKKEFVEEDKERVTSFVKLLSPPILRYIEYFEYQSKETLKKFGFFIGNSKKMNEFYKTVQGLSRLDPNLIIEGETGTGKELAAKAIHKLSSRKSEVFRSVDCGTLTESILESELFGHVKNAFNGAQDKTGYFENTKGGTIFLDEIQSASISFQEKLRQVIETGNIQKVGDTQKVIKVDVRIIVASNKDLLEEIDKGNFLRDLYYRFPIKINLPPLRERIEDIPLLSEAFLQEFNSISQELDKHHPVLSFEDNVFSTLSSDYDWNGNVRELKNVINRAYVKCSTESENLITSKHIKDSLENPNSSYLRFTEIPFRGKVIELLKEFNFDLESTKMKIDKIAIEYALDVSENKTKAAEFLNLQRSKLLRLEEK